VFSPDRNVFLSQDDAAFFRDRVSGPCGFRGGNDRVGGWQEGLGGFPSFFRGRFFFLDDVVGWMYFKVTQGDFFSSVTSDTVFDGIRETDLPCVFCCAGVPRHVTRYSGVLFRP